MSDYVQTTFFGPKDDLPSGDPNKRVRGREIDPELDNIAAAIATKFDNTNVPRTAGSSGVGYNGAPIVTSGLENGKVCIIGPGSSSFVILPQDMVLGATYGILNNTGGVLTVSPSTGVTLLFAGNGATGTRSVTNHGLAVVWIRDASTAYITGPGVF